MSSDLWSVNSCSSSTVSAIKVAEGIVASSVELLVFASPSWPGSYRNPGVVTTQMCPWLLKLYQVPATSSHCRDGGVARVWVVAELCIVSKSSGLPGNGCIRKSLEVTRSRGSPSSVTTTSFPVDGVLDTDLVSSCSTWILGPAHQACPTAASKYIPCRCWRLFRWPGTRSSQEGRRTGRCAGLDSASSCSTLIVCELNRAHLPNARRISAVAAGA
jgi:hypothetical protein